MAYPLAHMAPGCPGDSLVCACDGDANGSGYLAVNLPLCAKPSRKPDLCDCEPRIPDPFATSDEFGMENGGVVGAPHYEFRSPARPMRVSTGQASSTSRMGLVALRRDPFEIPDPVVELVAVPVVDLMDIRRGRSDKRCGDDAVDPAHWLPPSRTAALGNVETDTVVAVDKLFGKDRSRCLGANLAIGRHGVAPLVADNRKPSGFAHATDFIVD